MAIGTDDTIEKFGTQDDIDSSSAAVTDGSFSVAGDLAQWTNDDDAPMARAILEAAFATAPTVGGTIQLFARHMDTEGTNDAPVPTANYPHVLVGIFPVKDDTSTNRYHADIYLPNLEASQTYEFYVRNNAGQTMSAGWTIHITPITVGPHA